MRVSSILCLSILFSIAASAQQRLLSPKEFLGYELGDRFTRHHRVVEYFQHVATASPNMKLSSYGETYEHRPLMYAIVASADNLRDIETVRMDNLRRAGMEAGSPSTKVSIVWLSYNVHGNEANSMEAAMQTLFELADPNNEKSKEWLKNTVVIIDPCINPDGRDRYANFYNQYGNSPANSAMEAKEHREPWPNGRTNHYWFDLNRDWAWLTQTESQSRIKIYNQWLPHVHVDFHEQGPNNPYYFAPAAEPYHEIITPWQREFQVMIGKNHAKYFDAQGWLYFTKEVFDLYYPSYGDSYPTFNGAIGMTYEQAGGGGLSVMTKEGDPLTLKDRLTHHLTTGLSTVEITSQQSARVLSEFEKYFRDNLNNPSGVYKTFVLKADNNPDKVQRLLALLDNHQVKYGHPATGKATKGFDFSTQTVQNFNLAAEDVVINIFQPKSKFITTLFEPQSKIADSATYDITAWNLMYGSGLKGYALNEKIDVGKAFQVKTPATVASSEKPYAYIFKYQSLADVEFLALLMKKGIEVRSSLKAFTVEGKNFEAGTLIITRRNNEGVPDFDSVVQSLAQQMNRTIFTTRTGFVETGKDFGSGYVNYLKPPRIAVLVGEQTYSNSAGEVWYFFEQQIEYPITQIGTDYLKSIDLKKYDVLVVPEGNYRIFDESLLTVVSDWVSGGGRLVVLGSGLNAFADQKGFALKKYANEDAKKAAEQKEKDQKMKDALTPYGDAERKSISEGMPGAVYKTTLDSTHPLAFGLGGAYYSLRENTLKFDYLEGGWNVGVIKGKAKPVLGFAGYNVNMKLDNSLVFGVEDKGRGNVVYFVDNPLFRCFWENGKMVFANAVFIVGGQ